MNTIEAHRQDKLKKLLDEVNLSQHNLAMAQEYLLADPGDESLLQSAEPMNFRTIGMTNRYHIGEMLNDLCKAGRQQELERLLRLFWAVGKSTAVFLWCSHLGKPYEEEKLPWRLGVLGKAACAAMEAEAAAGGFYAHSDIPWLHELAKTEPEVLEEAQTLNGTPWDNMKLILAGILVTHSTDKALTARQQEIIFENNMGSMGTVLPGAGKPEQKLLTDYIAAGDPSAPVPIPASVQYPAVDAASAVYAVNSVEATTGLLAGPSFMAAQRDDRAMCALRVYLMLYPRAVFNTLTRLLTKEEFLQKLDFLKAKMPGGGVTILLYTTRGNYHYKDWCLQIIERCRDDLAEALSLADPSQYAALTEMEYQVPQDADLPGRIVTFLVKSVHSNKNELRAFLTATGSMADSEAILTQRVSQYTNYPGPAAKQVCDYRREHGWDDFACRCAAVLGLVFEGRAMQRMFEDEGVQTAPLQEMAEAMLSRELPAGTLLKIFAGFSDNTYYDDKVKVCIRDAACAAVKKLQYVPELCEAAKKGQLFARFAAVSALDDLSAGSDEARRGLLAAAGDSSKQIQELLLTILPTHPDWAQDYANLLKSKKAAERLLAVQVLAKLGQREILEGALETEKSAKVADAIRAALGAEAPAEAPLQGVDDLVQRTLAGGKVRKIQWLLDKPLPELHLADENRTSVSEDRRNALLVSYCELGRIGRSSTAAEIAKGIDEGDLAALANEVYEIWFAAGAQVKQKWVLAFAAVFGGAAMTPKLTRAINDWPQNARGAIACEAVTALAMSSDPAALVIVDSISRKFKFRQVKVAAAAALESAAQELGISAEELADRIVPDLGFGKDGSRVFDYGKRSFTVRLTPTLELEITNDAGKTLKNLPAPGKTDDETAAGAYEDFKTMKKQIKTTVTAQKARLEAALSALRCWDAAAWRALFVENPIMHQFAMSLIWGVYEDSRLTDTFRYMEDGSFNTVDEEEYTLPEQAKIGLVHPVELDSETLEAWKQQLEDYEITQSIHQLDRPVHHLEPGMAELRSLETFGGKKLNGLSLSGKLLGQGWYRGSVQDAGGFYTYYREDTGLGLGVELNFSGTFVGYDEGEPVTVYDAVFYKAGTVKRGSYCYDVPQAENIFALGQIPARYYSEIVLQLTRATASSTETDPDWKKNRD